MDQKLSGLYALLSERIPMMINSLLYMIKIQGLYFLIHLVIPLKLDLGEVCNMVWRGGEKRYGAKETPSTHH